MNTCVRNVRIDFSGPQLRLVEIESLRISVGKRNFLAFSSKNGWSEIQLYGDAERLDSAKDFRVRTDGIGPQHDLPTFEEPKEKLPLFVEMLARAKCEAN